MSHDCAHVEAVLTGEAPWPAGEGAAALVAGCPACGALHAALDEVDGLARALPTAALPPAARARIGAALQREAAPRPLRRFAAPAAAVAAAALLWTLQPPPPGSAGPMVERGAGGRLPQVALKVAVVGDHGPSRHAHGAPVPAGSTLYFRASLDQPAELQLLRVDARGAAPVGRWRLDPGEHDLMADGGALGWQVEPGEGDAVWALLAAPADAPPLPRLAGPADALCAAARGAGYACDARLVEVQP